MSFLDQFHTLITLKLVAFICTYLENAINKLNFTTQVLYIHELSSFVCDPLSTHNTKCTCSIKNLCFIGLALQVHFYLDLIDMYMYQYCTCIPFSTRFPTSQLLTKTCIKHTRSFLVPWTYWYQYKLTSDLKAASLT